MHLTYLLPLLFLSPITAASPKTRPKSPAKNAILLSTVKTLTLRSDSQTSHRRVASIPQLRCLGPACKNHMLSLLQCTNQGSDYDSESIQWSCAADLPVEFKLGSTDVQCEGYRSADDEWVLKGSCGVEYRLLLTEKGEERYGKGWGNWGGGGGNDYMPSSENGVANWLFWILWLCVAAWILWAVVKAWWNAPAGAGPLPRRPGFGGGGWGGWGGGGGGGGNPWDPPPPYPGTGRKFQPASGLGQGQEGWRPGFWSGMLGGAAAGYMAGNRGGRQQEPPPARGGGFFGGGGSNNGMGSQRTGSSGSSGSGSGSSSRYESTGFGSTSRR